MNDRLEARRHPEAKALCSHDEMAARAVALANHWGFILCCTPEQGKRIYPKPTLLCCDLLSMLLSYPGTKLAQQSGAFQYFAARQEICEDGISQQR